MIPNIKAKEISDVHNWRGKVTQRRNAIADSDNFSSDNEKDLLLIYDNGNKVGHTNFCKNCCSYQNTRRLRRNKTNSLLSKGSDIKASYRSSSYREQLEMKVLNDEIYVQELNEKQLLVKEQVNIITDVLKALSMYAHCLEIKHKVSLRLQQLINKIVISKENLINNEYTKWENISKNLLDVFHTCAESSDLPDAINDNLDDYREKLNDFTKASTNFCHILQDQNSLSNSQLRKLELQYDEIKLNYQDSNTSTDAQLTQLINSRTVTAEKCLQHMTPILHYSIEEEKSTWCILKELTLSNFSTSNSSSHPDRATSVKSLPDKLGARSNSNEEKPKCTCLPRNVYPKSNIEFNVK